MMTLVLAAAIGTATAAFNTLSHAQEKKTPDADAKNVLNLSEAEVSALVRKWKSGHYPTRDAAFKSLQKAVLDMPGFTRIAEARFGGDSEMEGRAKQIFEHHLEMHRPALEKEFLPVFSPKAAPESCDRAWIDGLPDYFPASFPKIDGLSRSDVVGMYLNLANANGAKQDGSPEYTNYGVASEYMRIDDLKHVLPVHFGKKDFTAQMDKEAARIRALAEQMVDRDECWREARKLPSRRDVMPDFQEGALPRTRERLLGLLGRHLDDRRTAHHVPESGW